MVIVLVHSAIFTIFVFISVKRILKIPQLGILLKKFKQDITTMLSDFSWLQKLQLKKNI